MTLAELSSAVSHKAGRRSLSKVYGPIEAWFRVLEKVEPVVVRARRCQVETSEFETVRVASSTSMSAVVVCSLFWLVAVR